ncbi:MAG: hypothetical protein Q9184_001895 [Pyrenodesmia sp. 2 TL-2023]
MPEEIVRAEPAKRIIKRGVPAATTVEGIWGYQRLPKLVYVPFRWGEEDKTDWTLMSHNTRLSLLNGRGGSIMPRDVENFHINGLIDEHSGSKAVLAIVPKAYVGWYSELQQGTLTVWGSGEVSGAYYVVDHATLAKFQVANAEQVVQKLSDMYFANIPRCLVRYERLVDGLGELFRQLVDVVT